MAQWGALALAMLLSFEGSTGKGLLPSSCTWLLLELSPLCGLSSSEAIGQRLPSAPPGIDLSTVHLSTWQQEQDKDKERQRERRRGGAKWKLPYFGVMGCCCFLILLKYS